MSRRQKKIALAVLRKAKRLKANVVADHAAIWFNVLVLKLSGKL